MTGIKRYRPEEIGAKLRHVEVLVGQGRTQADAIRKTGVTEQNYYRSRKAYGGRRRSCCGSGSGCTEDRIAAGT